MAPDPIVIVGAARTPMGAFHGDLSPLAAPRLGAGNPESVGCTTVKKAGGSGMRAALEALDLKRGVAALCVVGGGGEVDAMAIERGS